MRIGFVLLHLEAADGAVLLAVPAAGALDAVGLPVVSARVVEPEGGEVEEGLLGLPRALALLRPQDGRLLADQPLLVAAVGLADVEEHAGAGVGDLHAEGGGPAGGGGGGRPGGGRRDAVARCRR